MGLLHNTHQSYLPNVALGGGVDDDDDGDDDSDGSSMPSTMW